MRVTAQRLISASPEVVFTLVQALDRMPDHSPEQRRFEWTGGTPGQAGATFRGWNSVLGIRWWTNGSVTEVEHPRSFVFATGTINGDRQEKTNRWSSSLEPQGGGTLVTEELQTLRLPIHLKLIGPILCLRWLQLRAGIRRTLARLTEECEGSA